MAFTRFHVHLEEELKKEFEEYAKAKGLTLSAMFRLAMIERITRETPNKEGK